MNSDIYQPTIISIDGIILEFGIDESPMVHPATVLKECYADLNRIELSLAGISLHTNRSQVLEEIDEKLNLYFDQIALLRSRQDLQHSTKRLLKKASRKQQALAKIAASLPRVSPFARPAERELMMMIS